MFSMYKCFIMPSLTCYYLWYSFLYILILYVPCSVWDSSSISISVVLPLLLMLSFYSQSNSPLVHPALPFVSSSFLKQIRWFTSRNRMVFSEALTVVKCEIQPNRDALLRFVSQDLLHQFAWFTPIIISASHQLQYPLVLTYLTSSLQPLKRVNS